MSENRKYDVLIIGCGPTGATLANLLRARGRSVAIFDREPDVYPTPRAMVLDPESCRIYTSMGILQRLIPEDASPYARNEFVDQKRRPLMTLDFLQARKRFGFPMGGMVFHQPALERLLRDDFPKGVAVDAFLGYDVCAVDGSGEAAKVIATHRDTGERHEFTGRYAVGADGGGSFCRSAIGSERVDFGYRRQWIVVDLVVHDQKLFDSLPDGSEIRCRRNRSVVYFKGHHKHVRFDFEAGEALARNFTAEDALEAISEYFDPSSCEILRVQPFLFHGSMPKAWRSGRLLLAGDAAHQSPPFSGQGLNMGIRDAVNLAFKFELLFRELAGPALLDTYQEECWDHCARLIEGASKRGRMISASTPLAVANRNFSFFLGRRKRRTGFSLMRRMTNRQPYQRGLIGGSEASGGRMIRPRVTTAGGETWLDDLLGPEFSLVVNSPTTGADMDWFREVLGGTVLQLGRDLSDANGELTRWLGRNDASSVLIRPDWYVFETGDDGSSLCRSLREKLEALQD